MLFIGSAREGARRGVFEFVGSAFLDNLWRKKWGVSFRYNMLKNCKLRGFDVNYFLQQDKQTMCQRQLKN